MLSPNENAQKYYKLYNKAKNAARHGKELAEKIQVEVDYLESVKESLNRAETLSDLRETEQELTAQELIKSGHSPTSKKDKQDKINLSEFKSSDGLSIFVGKNNKQNELILKIASPEDIWLHTQNIPGSHVLIKLPPENTEVPENTLHEAVYLAAYYSRAKESSNVPVVFTRKKTRKETYGFETGVVIYTHEKMLAVNPDIAKIDALKKSLIILVGRALAYRCCSSS